MVPSSDAETSYLTFKKCNAVMLYLCPIKVYSISPDLIFLEQMNPSSYPE